MFRFYRSISFPIPDVPGSLRRRKADRAYDAEVREFARQVRNAFRGACLVIGVRVDAEAAAAGRTFHTPRIGGVVVGPPVVVTVEMLAGQVPSDLERPARRLADLLGAHDPRIERIGGPWVRLVLPDPDPPPDRVVSLRHGPRRVPGCTRTRFPAGHSTG